MGNDDRLQHPERDEYLTVRQVARTLHFDLQAVYTRIRSGAIGAKKLHVRPHCDDACRCPYRVRRSDLQAYLRLDDVTA